MNLPQALHTAARRYCQTQFTDWITQYAELHRCGADRLADGNYTPEALNLFPRYNVLRAILVEVERIDARELVDLGEMRELLLLAGLLADDLFTRKPQGPIDAAAIDAERQRFCDLIRHLSTAELLAVEPLPWRRVLSASESEKRWGQLRRRWTIQDHFWYPLATCDLPEIAAFSAQQFHRYCETGCLVEVLLSKGVSRIWELREGGGGPDYEQEVALLDPKYNGLEGYWFSESLDWIIYASHESSITVGGWLLAEVQRHWPEWGPGLWRSPFS